MHLKSFGKVKVFQKVFSQGETLSPAGTLRERDTPEGSRARRDGAERPLRDRDSYDRNYGKDYNRDYDRRGRSSDDGGYSRKPRPSYQDNWDDDDDWL